MSGVATASTVPSTPITSTPRLTGLSVGGSVVAGCEVEVAGRFGQVEGGEDGLVPAGEGGALGDAAVGGGEGDQVHAVEFVTQVAPGVAGAGFRDADEKQCQPT